MGMAAVVEDTGVQVIVGVLHGTILPAMVLGLIMKGMCLAKAVGVTQPGSRWERG